MLRGWALGAALAVAVVAACAVAAVAVAFLLNP